jgi:pimeloyl-ACP methyl ester carboxylesterase
MINPSRQTLALGQGDVSQLVWENDAPLLHFAHATGFNAETYRGMLSPLANHFRIVASDARGHGSTALPAEPGMPRGWKIFRDDLIAVLDRIAPNGAILAGHSMGGAVSLMVAAARPDKVKSLVLVEPVLMPRALWWRMLLVRLGLRAAEPGLAERALKRRDVFPSLEMAMAAYKGRGAFATWPPETISDYINGGFEPVGGGFRLRCRPQWESEIFRSAPLGVSGFAARIRCPLTIIHGEFASTSSAGELDTIRRLYPSARIVGQKGASHFLPMEYPQLVRDEILRSAAAL